MADTENNKNSNLLASTSAPALRFPGFTEPWRISPLNHFAKKITKKNKDNSISNILSNSANLGIIPQSDYFDRDIANRENTDGYYVIEHGDFVYNPRKSVSAPYGPVNIYEGQEIGIISPLYLCFQISGIEPTYLRMFFKGCSWHRFIYENGDSGVRHDRVSIKDDLFLQLPVSYPTKEEQCKITSLLLLLDERIATQRRLIEDLEKLKSSINETLYATLTTNYKTSFSEIGCDYGGLTGKSAEDFGKGKPFITYLNVYQNQIITDCNFDYVEIGDGENQNKVRKGDLLFTLSSETPEETGYSAVYMGDVKELYLNSFCFGIHIPESVLVYPPYMGYLTSTSYFRRKIIPYAQGSTRFNLHKPSLMSMRFSLPTKENQIKIFNILQLIVEKISTEKEILSNFTYQRNYLLTKLFI